MGNKPVLHVNRLKKNLNVPGKKKKKRKKTEGLN